MVAAASAALAWIVTTRRITKDRGGMFLRRLVSARASVQVDVAEPPSKLATPDALYVSPSFAEKCAAVRQAVRRRDLALITDFDHTLTSHESHECHDVLRATDLMPPEFRREMTTLLDFSKPMTLSADEWWGRANDLMIHHGMSASLVEPIVARASFVPRPGLAELLELCEKQETPVLIVSAGIADLIEAFLEQSFGARPGPLLRVSANRMVFSGTGDHPSGDRPVVGWAPAGGPCHSHNKNLTFSRERSFFDAACMPAAGPVRHALVLGDRPYDVRVTELVRPGLGTELRVGFFDAERVEGGGRFDLTDYTDAYDIVLPASSPAGLGPVLDILRL
eukprot:CAMPEP_0172628620 /NCGR_PEP_ID=MMETSP1068-20121228/162908_1 /TAXON_ID=35684 /ORGANISM="Pseudopedinella elastica, Strain CCMP716" /LENGTH=335 /DNA_ID=CAMNT_0013438891 /DNA_START=70 /DNA_END=1080 /DNA_ORIENTATION=-